MLTDYLQDVLDEAHRGHTYVTDLQQYKKSEHWVKGLTGDCEDFALWCRDKLKSLAIDSSLVHCITETGQHHLVCEVQGYILDNRSKWVKPRDDIEYSWIAKNTPDGRWVKIIKD